jgi:hypothetical protein
MLATDYEESEMPTIVPLEAVFAADEANRETLESLNDLCMAWRPTRWNHAKRRYVPLPGIAYHKLCSNEYWFITAEECREALEAWTTRELPDREGWLDWIEFLTAAVDEIGIRVW